jgi:hypothetical protein
MDYDMRSAYVRLDHCRFSDDKVTVRKYFSFKMTVYPRGPAKSQRSLYIDFFA